MTDGIVDFGARLRAKVDDNDALRARVDSLLDCSKILADAIEQMWDFAGREEIVSTLRRAADLLESEG